MTPAALLDDLESVARQKQSRIELLREQILKLAEQGRRSPPPPAPLPAPDVLPGDAHAVPDPPDDELSPMHEVADPHDGHQPDSHGGPTDHHTDGVGHAEGQPPHSGHSAAEHSEDGGPHARQVTATRINRLALADNLFGAGQTDLALQAYSNIQLTRLPAANRYWIEYQLANCYRKLGDTAEAERRYRRIAGAIDGGWYAAHARWWLDAISTRTALERELATIQRTVQTIEEQLEDLANE